MHDYKWNLLLKYLILAAFATMIFNPSITLEGAKSGLILWFNVIIPSLLPAIIISNIIISVYGSSFKNPYLYIIFAGLFCGYPLGAATAVQISALTPPAGKRQRNAMQLLMAACNNSSPMFITSFVILTTLNARTDTFRLLLSIYTPLLIIILISFFMLKTAQNETAVHNDRKKPINQLNLKAVDQAIMNGFEIVTKLGGYIILFSIFATFVQCIPIQNELLKCTFSGLIEITTGIHVIGNSSLPLFIKEILCCISVSFGGLSCICQTQSVIHNSFYSIKKYIYHKFLITLLTIVTSFVFIYVF